MSINSLFTQTCAIYRKTSTKDQTTGLFTTSWTLISATVKCRIDYQFVTSGFYTQSPNGQIRGNDYVGYFFPSENILIGDKVIWTNITMYARPINPVYGKNNIVHHLEVPLGLQET